MEQLLARVTELAQNELLPLVEAIDREGVYPESFMRKLGEIGGFASLGTIHEGGANFGLGAQLAVLREVGKVCGSTGFSAWCQSACAWYLHLSPNQTVKQKYLPEVLSGRLLAGTGMSNTVKHTQGLEKLLLQAERVEGGYRVTGTLPWISNVEKNHIWACTAQLSDAYVMFIVEGWADGVTLHACPEFCALEGTRTFRVELNQVFISDDQVLADSAQFPEFMSAIKPGFVLLQLGFASGIIDASLAQIHLSNQFSASVNQFLPDGEAAILLEFEAAWERALALAEWAWRGEAVDARKLLMLRKEAAELALRAAQSSALHAGARGYLMSSPVQRHSREAMFVAIVTPSLKQLYVELNEAA